MPTNGQIQMASSKSLFTLPGPSSVQAIRHQAYNKLLDMKALVASYSMIASYSRSEAIAVAGMRCFILRKAIARFGLAKIWGAGDPALFYLRDMSCPFKRRSDRD